MSEREIEVVEGSARATTRLAIRRRQHLTEEAAAISDLALSIVVQFTDHRTCFIRDCDYDHCHSCEDVITAAQWIDREMDRAGVPVEARKIAGFRVEDYEDQP
jgi:hypothetical protein